VIAVRAAAEDRARIRTMSAGRGQEHPVPKSRTRQKSHYTAPQERSAGPGVNPPWFVPVLGALLLIGLAWIVVTYLTNFDFPIPGIRSWNLAIGFAFALGGLGMATRWK